MAKPNSLSHSPELCLPRSLAQAYQENITPSENIASPGAIVSMEDQTREPADHTITNSSSQLNVRQSLRRKRPPL